MSTATEPARPRCFPPGDVMHELLEALSPEELRQYIAHYQWRQAHEEFPEKPRSMYQSKAYFLLRTNQIIYDAKLVLAEHGEK